jgi:hypothetical protein
MQASCPPQSCDLTASVSRMLGLQVCTTTSSLEKLFIKDNWLKEKRLPIYGSKHSSPCPHCDCLSTITSIFAYCAKQPKMAKG